MQRPKQPSFSFSGIEFGNFEDEACKQFRKEKTTFMNSGLTGRVYIKDWSDLECFIDTKSGYKFWMDIKRKNVKKIVYSQLGSFIIIAMKTVPYVTRQKTVSVYEIQREPKTRIAAPEASDNNDTSNANWLAQLEFTRSILFNHVSPSDWRDVEKVLHKDHTLIEVNTEMSYIERPVFEIEFPELLFNTLYLLLCLNTKVPGLLLCHERNDQINNTIVRFVNQDYAFEWIDQALRDLLDDSHFYPVDFPQLFERAIEKRQHSMDESFIDKEKNLFQIRKIIITPTGMRFYDKTVEGGNRVLRKYSPLQLDRFVRVNFCDEDLKKLSAEKFTNLHPRILAIMSKGIQVANRNFQALAYSNSQLRAHSCWFLSPTNELTVNSILGSLGDFSSIRVVAKYASRIGLCFSHTYEGITKCYDVEEGVIRGKWDFTDGAGKISQSFATDLANTNGLSYGGKPYIPSAFQFRMGGAKGVVVVDPYLPYYTDKDLVLTKSQIKFDVKEVSDFEMITYSKRFRVATLNRQVIALLSTNGVKDQVFLEMLARELSDVSDAVKDKTKIKRLLRKIRDHPIGVNVSRILKLNTLDEMTRQVMPKDKFSNFQYFFQIDPFFCTIIKSMLKMKLNDLKQARIPVEKGTLLIGVPDFTGVLEEDEVFIQLSALEHTDLVEEGTYPHGGIVSGTVCVTRNPCLHPGDIRKLKAVSDPNKIQILSHLKDVIVFSQKGQRPQASKMSGGDYDGDLFMVLWDPRLLQFEEHPPMDHETLEPKTKQGGCSFNDIGEFLTEYIVNDNLGIVAFLHLEHYDQERLGAKSKVCLELAEHHSHQVDYAKTGTRKALHPYLMSSKRPHYMPKAFAKETYRSEKVLGKMYDAVLKEEKQVKKLEKLPNCTKDENASPESILSPYFKILDQIFIQYKPLKQLLNFQKEAVTNLMDDDIVMCYEQVLVLYEKYKKDLKKLLQAYDMESEAVFLSGFFDTKHLENKCGKRDYKLKMEINMFADKFTKAYHQSSEELIRKHTSCQLSQQDIATMFYIAVRNDNKTHMKIKRLFGYSFYYLVIDKMVGFKDDQNQHQ
ncbi:hypothetical protein C9374_003647 [Naegleria lovaniensis]|uniref:RNA-dependent RNA polymerase n=1 Tax=Naegleria lovaniensis TaxID=51637 RepID=A0AA88H3J9_NAELO|nr:uncharacterized protein C9374_003647 [Naegleria lovaniensis]KAG2393883.1 hypothetical protein C9374_003647 [Naegleria lovaniensis]